MNENIPNDLFEAAGLPSLFNEEQQAKLDALEELHVAVKQQFPDMVEFKLEYKAEDGHAELRIKQNGKWETHKYELEGNDTDA